MLKPVGYTAHEQEVLAESMRLLQSAYQFTPRMAQAYPSGATQTSWIPNAVPTPRFGPGRREGMPQRCKRNQLLFFVCTLHDAVCHFVQKLRESVCSEVA